MRTGLSKLFQQYPAAYCAFQVSFPLRHSSKKVLSDRRNFAGRLKREVVKNGFNGPESYFGGFKIRKDP